MIVFEGLSFGGKIKIVDTNFRFWTKVDYIWHHKENSFKHQQKQFMSVSYLSIQKLYHSWKVWSNPHNSIILAGNVTIIPLLLPPRGFGIARLSMISLPESLPTRKIMVDKSFQYHLIFGFVNLVPSLSDLNKFKYSHTVRLCPLGGLIYYLTSNCWLCQCHSTHQDQVYCWYVLGKKIRLSIKGLMVWKS